MEFRHRQTETEAHQTRAVLCCITPAFIYRFPSAQLTYYTTTQGGSVALQSRPEARIGPGQQFCAPPGRLPHILFSHAPQLRAQIISPSLGRAVGEADTLIEGAAVAVAVVDMLGVADADGVVDMLVVSDADILGVAEAIAVADTLGVTDAVAVAVVDTLGVTETEPSEQGGSVALQSRPDARIGPGQQFCAPPGRVPHIATSHLPQLRAQVTSPDDGKIVGEADTLIEGVGVVEAIAVVDMLGVTDAVAVALADTVGVTETEPSEQGGSVALQTRPDARICRVQQFRAPPGRLRHPRPPHLPQLRAQITSPDLGKVEGVLGDGAGDLWLRDPRLQHHHPFRPLVKHLVTRHLRLLCLLNRPRHCLLAFRRAKRPERQTHAHRRRVIRAGWKMSSEVEAVKPVARPRTTKTRTTRRVPRILKLNVVLPDPPRLKLRILDLY